MTAAAGSMLDPSLAIVLTGAATFAAGWTDLAVDALRQRMESVGSMVTVAEAESGAGESSLLASARDTPEKLQLTVEVLDATMRTALEDKIRTLGRTWASGVMSDDQAGVEIERMLTGALAQCEAPHVAVLRVIMGDYRKSPHADSGDQIFGAGWTPDLLRATLPAYAPAVPSIIARLAAVGLIGESSTMTLPEISRGTSYGLTPIGDRAVRRLATGNAGTD